ncbi:glycosyltransferase family 2 protein [Lederbergia graminis]|uniref:Glycosyltransferase family 2 protein n=1 Tax=Lederbergia graminis TaxID=735518 RepID=A0ABW0LI54_9BACI
MGNLHYKISVIIPTFNREKLIMKAIESLTNQTYKNFEIIVVDDFSNDNTQNLLENDVRIKYIRHDENKGAAEARNTGIKASSGEFIAFLDSDDEWLPTKLERQLKVFENNSNTGVVYTGFRSILKDKDEREVLPQKKGNIYIELLKGNCVGTTSTVMVRTDLLKKVGGFDTELLSCQDWDLWIRLANITEFDFVSEALVLFNQHEGARISSNVSSVVKGHIDFYNKYISIIKKLKKSESRHFYYKIARKVIISGIVDKNKSTIKKGRIILKDSIFPFPNSLNAILLYLSTFLNRKVLNKLYFYIKKNKTSYQAK